MILRNTVGLLSLLYMLNDDGRKVEGQYYPGSPSIRNYCLWRAILVIVG